MNSEPTLSSAPRSSACYAAMERQGRKVCQGMGVDPDKDVYHDPGLWEFERRIDIDDPPTAAATPRWVYEMLRDK